MHAYSRMCILYAVLAQLVERTPFKRNTQTNASSRSRAVQYGTACGRGFETLVRY